MSRAPIVIAVLLITFAATPLTADESASPSSGGSIATDRPTDSASPTLVPWRTLQFELGYKFSRHDTRAGRVDTQELPDLLTRYGITERFEARLTASGWTFRNTDTGRQDGFTDVSLGAKFALADERAAARTRRDYRTADELKARIEAAGAARAVIARCRISTRSRSDTPISSATRPTMLSSSSWRTPSA